MLGRLLVIALALGLAGCATPDQPALDPAPATSPARPADSLPLVLDDCQAMRWSVPVLGTRLAPYLPSGFEPQSTSLPAGVEQAARLVFEAVECSGGLGREDSALRSIQFGRLYTPVIPPRELRDDRLDTQHAYVFDAMAAADDWRRTAQALGLPVFDGGAIVAANAQGWSASLAVDTVGTFSVGGRFLDGQVHAESLRQRAFSQSATDLYAWSLDFAQRNATSGVGTWTTTPDSWVAAVVGATQGLATFHLESFSVQGLVAPAGVVSGMAQHTGTGPLA